MKKNIIILGIFLLVELTAAQGIVINKTAPMEIKINEILNVEIEIWNRYNENVSVILKEIIDFGEALDKESLVQPQEIIEKEDGVIIEGIKWLNSDGKCDIGCVEGDKICEKADCGCTFAEDSDCSAFIIPTSPRYEWSFSLGANEKKKIQYRVKPLNLGVIKISPTIAETRKGKFYSNLLTIKVKCDANGLCEGKENYGNCPEDCNSGGKDDYCDRVLDGICDPDCRKEADPDCIPAVCGDNLCEGKKGETYNSCPLDCEKPVICGDNFCDERENYGNCPEDCNSGGKDNYCDGVFDNKCDPDCQRKLDSDCFCNLDGVCEELENYGNCPEDCPSGSKDGYCDGIVDNKCDPDCMEEDDPDCGRGNALWYLVIFIVLIFLFLIYKKIKK